MLNALSFDIEDWFHLGRIGSLADTDKWASFPTLVEGRTDELLEICDEANVKATFFIVGWIADRYPDLIRRIAERGHELGSHSYWHQNVHSLSEDAFREDLKRSIDAIGNASGVRVRSFRAPSFSIIPGCEWALDVLLDEGMRYDASLFPAVRIDGGYPCERAPHLFTATPSGRGIVEFPMSVARIGGRVFGFSGGGYLRLFPLWLIKRKIAALNTTGVPAVVYLHPRDIAPDCPEAKMSRRNRWALYVGLDSAAEKLRGLLSKFRFGPCETVLSERLEEAIQCSTS
jgi:polysaccharide deacetylase family protein (PEP-CTERM system associated)